MKNKVKNNYSCCCMIFIMLGIFLVNLFISDYNKFWLFLSGGGDLVEILGISFRSFFEDKNIYQCITYGYTQTSIIHLLVNLIALWYVGLYIVKKLDTKSFVCIFHIGIAIAGIIFVCIFKNEYMYGASPGIYACLGLLISWLIKDKSLLAEYKQQEGFYYLRGYLFLANIIGLHTLIVHLLGLIVGFLLGFLIKHKNM